MEGGDRLRRLCADGRWDVAERLAGEGASHRASLAATQTTPSSVDA